MTTKSLDSKRTAKLGAEARRQTINSIAEYLQHILGRKITAYLSGVKNPRNVGLWATGDVIPRNKAQVRLRYAYPAARMITDAYDPETAKAWFFGTNTRLNDEAPAYILRHAESLEDMKAIEPVARIFAGLTE